jgi:hypothetical protein
MRPLSQILQRRRPLGEVIRMLFYPSDWWLKAHYGRDPASSMMLTRWGRHPLGIGQWLLRRARSLAS